MGFGSAQPDKVFTRYAYVDILLDSLRYCQKEKACVSMLGA